MENNETVDNLVSNVGAVMKRNAIQCTATGYQQAWLDVIKMFNSGKTKKEIFDHAHWVTENYETALKYSIDKIEDV